MGKRQQEFDPRQNMHSSDVELFHNYDENGRTVDLHHHDFYEIYYFLSGDVDYRVEGKNYVLQKGDLLLISPGVFHQPVVRPGIPYERIVLWINRGYLNQFANAGADLSGCFIPGGAVLLQSGTYQRGNLLMLMEELYREQRTEQFGKQLYCHALFIQVMTQINRMTAVPSPALLPQPGTDLVEQVLSYISEHYAEKLTLQLLADRFYVSKYHLSHTFSAQVGTGIYRYIQLKRLLAARELIADGVSPSQASQSCGFPDYSNFYRAFKAEYGVSPRGFTTKTST